MVKLQDVLAARERIASIAHVTPLDRAHALGNLVGCELYLKAENLQRTGSFKIRGAANKLAMLSQQEKARGVIAASAGNHAQGVALAARELGVAATVVMPRDAPFAKVEATANYGAEVILAGHSFDEAIVRARALAKDRDLTLVHAYDDPDIIAGQGTVGLEILGTLPEVDVVLVPVGGGGLLAGIALAVKERSPRTRVIGVQTVASPAWSRSFREKGLIDIPATFTMADGIAVGRPGLITEPLIRRYATDILTVSEEKIAQAILLLLEWGKLLVEGAGAVGLAALLDRRIPDVEGKKVAVVLSGGNVDPTLLARIIEQGLAEAGRFMVLRVVVLDRPGRLAQVLECIALAEANVLEVIHHRKGIHVPVGQVEVELVLETKDAQHRESVLAAFSRAGYTPIEPAPSIGLRPAMHRLVSGEAAKPA